MKNRVNLSLASVLSCLIITDRTVGSTNVIIWHDDESSRESSHLNDIFVTFFLPPSRNKYSLGCERNNEETEEKMFLELNSFVFIIVHDTTSIR